MHQKSQTSGSRICGFTLVELLVVVALMAILATLAIAFFPNAANQQRESHAARLLQGWLNIAKQRALRDQAPRGVRLLVGQTTIGGVTLSNVVTSAQYIEQPDDYSGGQVLSAPPANLPAGYTPLNTLVFTPAPTFPNQPDLLNGYSNDLSTVSLWAVQPWQVAGSPAQPTPAQWGTQVNQWQWVPGDFLELYGTGLMYKITNVGFPQTNQIAIDPPLPGPLPPTTSYRVLRSPRAVDTETLNFPDGTVIDIGTNKMLPAGTGLPGNPLPWSSASANTGYYIDILFAPSGAVISRGVGPSNLNLWVRAPGEGPPGSPNDPNQVFWGSPTIVSVFVSTGFTGAYAVDHTPGQPYLQVGK